MEQMSILAIGAHPDDLEILCAGTLARYAHAGHRVTMAHLLNGDKGYYRMDSRELAGVRKREANLAGAVIGAQVIGGDLPDGELFSTIETRRRVMDIVRSARPDVIITHSPNDYCSDHAVTSQITCEASFYAAAPLFHTAEPAHATVPPVYFMDTVVGISFHPTEYVDITATLEVKRQMLRCHESQLRWLKEHDHTDVLELVETNARFRGLQCGVRYAEGFRLYEAWGRYTTTRLLP